MSRLRPALLLLLAAGLTTVGCDSSTRPIDDPLVFEGVIPSGGRESHPFVLTNSGTVRVEFSRIVEQPVEGFEPLEDVIWRLGVGIGRPSDGECSTSYSVAAAVGQLVVLGLNEAEYCLLVFDTGFVPEVRILEYSLTLSPGN